MVLAIIPARSGSKGVPHKNISRLGGFPLIQWTIAACKKSKLIDRVIVSTDSEHYAEIALNCGAEVPFLRPKNISDDKSTDLEFFVHALNWFELNNCLPETLVHMRPTTPFRDPIIIDKAILTFIDNPAYTSLRSVHQMPETAYKTFEMDSDEILKCTFTGSYELDEINAPRQSFPQTYSPNGYVDVLSTSFLREKNMLHGNKCRGFITDFSLEVDTKEDFKLLEFYLKSNPEIIELVKK